MQSALQSYRSDYSREISAKEQMLSFLAENNEIHFERGNLNRHFTGSGLLVDIEEKKILLNYHKFLDIWLCFGGHADGEGDLFLVAMRETVEESGIKNIKPVSKNIFDIGIHKIPARSEKSEPMHQHYDVLYLFQTSIDEPTSISNESEMLRWCSIDEARDLTMEDERMQRIIDKFEALL
jgi:8-oxo-dGTP pyrophosphatase MutT (NUDIX family)